MRWLSVSSDSLNEYSSPASVSFVQVASFAQFPSKLVQLTHSYSADCTLFEVLLYGTSLRCPIYWAGTQRVETLNISLKVGIL